MIPIRGAAARALAAVFALAACGPFSTAPAPPPTPIASPAATPAGSPAGSPTPPALPTAAAPKPPFDWKRGTLPASDPPAYMTAVAAGGPGFVAVGGTTWRGVAAPAGFQSQAAVWTSRDGADWERVPDQPSLHCDCSMRAIAAGPLGLVAVGGDSRDAGRIWTSRDGTSWRLLPPQPDRQATQLTAVAAGGPGLVAVGGRAVWTSVDGSAWKATGTSALEDASLDRLAAGGAAGLVALGSGAVWTSKDGAAWRRATQIPDTEAATLTTVGGVGDAVVAVGQRGLWRSRDGVSWQPAADDPAFDPIAVTSEGWVAHSGWSRASATPLGLVIVGATPLLGAQNGSPAILNTPTILFSKDLVTWAVGRIEPIDAPLVGIATNGSALVVVGDVIGAEARPAVWVARI